MSEFTREKRTSIERSLEDVLIEIANLDDKEGKRMATFSGLDIATATCADTLLDKLQGIYDRSGQQ